MRLCVRADSENVRWSLNLPERIKGALGKPRGVLLTVAAAVIGIILIFASSFESKPEDSGEIGLDEYKAMLESEVESMCANIRGVGCCRVMITFERGEENTYKGSQLVESKPPRVLGVSVLCDGGDADRIKADVTEMVCALFGIGANRVCVLPLKNQSVAEYPLAVRHTINQ